jgi:SAM-dependent methyltransferase
MISTQSNSRFFIKKSDFEKLLISLRNEGFRNAAVFALLRRRAFALSNRAGLTFDQEHNVKTCGTVQFSEVTIENGFPDYSYPYEPTPAIIIPTVLPKLQDSFGGFAFVDLGSGKGRVVLLASQFDFDRVIGIEFAQQLHQLAQENIKNYRGNDQRCGSLELICGDVNDFKYPFENCVIFIFNSFKKDLLSHIVNRLANSYAAKPRVLYVIFVNPEPDNSVIQILEGSNFLKRRHVFTWKDEFCLYSQSPYEVVVYEAV